MDRHGDFQHKPAVEQAVAASPWRAFLLAACVTLASFPASAGTEVNTATRAELEAITGVGPAMAAAILDERGRAPFKHWPNLIARVKGLGHTGALRLSSQGLTVAGEPYARTAEPVGAAAASSPR